FSFNFLLRGAVGHQIVNGPYIYSANPNRFPGNNALLDAFDTGIPEGLSPAFSSMWVEDGDFVRLDNFRQATPIQTKPNCSSGKGRGTKIPRWLMKESKGRTMESRTAGMALSTAKYQKNNCSSSGMLRMVSI